MLKKKKTSPKLTWTEQLDDCFEDFEFFTVDFYEEIQNSDILTQTANLDNTTGVTVQCSDISSLKNERLQIEQMTWIFWLEQLIMTTPRDSQSNTKTSAPKKEMVPDKNTDETDDDD